MCVGIHLQLEGSVCVRTGIHAINHDDSEYKGKSVVMNLAVDPPGDNDCEGLLTNGDKSPCQ